jgi:hypothetical protein
MGLFGFGKKKAAPSGTGSWYAVASKIASMLEVLIQQDPKMLASPYARVVLDKDWNVHVAADARDPSKLLGPRDVSFVLLREHQTQLTQWVEELKEGGMFTKIATDEYAKFLTAKLAATVQVID